MSNIFLLPSLKSVIETHGLSARKSLGQHFLLDTQITDRIARMAGDLRQVNVIEVGPGPGGLTRSLLTAGAKSLLVVEKDDRCIAAMEELKALSANRLSILHGDALAADLIAAVPAPRKIVANLPYNVGTALLLRWLDDIYRHGPEAYQSLTLMFQKEVALRLLADAGSKDYGRLSVLCQWLCECRWDMELPPGAFSPPPKVTSAVVTLTPRARPLVAVDKAALELITAKAFGQRRKMLRGALKGLAVSAETMLTEAGIDGTCRAEQLEIETLCRLAAAYQRLSINPASPS